MHDNQVLLDVFHLKERPVGFKGTLRWSVRKLSFLLKNE